MNPDPRSSRRRTSPEPRSLAIRTAPSSDDEHAIVFFRRHRADDPTEAVPGRDALNSYPTGVRAKMRAVLVAVAAAPPKRFAGGGYWESMRSGMAGWFELRVDGPGRHHYRLYCLLDYEALGPTKPLLVVIAGRDKPFRTTLTDRDYAQISALGQEYRARNPRSLA